MGGLNPSITHLYKLHGSDPVAVIGGAPCVVEDIKKLPKNVTLIAANEHAYKLGLKPLYYCFNNDPKKYKHLEPWLYHPSVNISSAFPEYSDFEIDTFKYDAGFTGQFACWLGCYITDGPVILCGMDLYGSKNHYWEQSRKHERFYPLKRKGLVESLERGWKKAYAEKTGCRNPERIYAMSGKLTEIFKPFTYC